MHLKFQPEDERFRQECRAFLRENLPEELARRARRGYHPLREDIQTWMRILNKRGWSVPNWPQEYGGPGWSPVQRFIFEEEMRAACAPVVNLLGTELVAPVIYTFGSAEQKAEHLPAIRNGDVLWCQGFSEPGAGSDLASLRTRAERNGNEYVVNGQKTWTTEGHNADMMITLVRTDSTVKPQAGISVLLIDMQSPGITVRPIYTIDEGRSVNEVFLDNVKVPADNLVGEEGKGWSYAKFLLTNERTASAEVPHTKHDILQLEEIARQEYKDGKPLAEDPVFARKLGQLKIDTLALEYAVLRVLTDDSSSSAAVASVIKTRGAELRQRAADLTLEALGDYGLAAAPDPEGVHNLRSGRAPTGLPEYGLGASARAMYRRATTIYGGSNEIQRTIIAKTILQL
ncbi:MAG: acyl-CoA dehydrogenase family protein [Porticoccaceae bacterium]|nr:acyl-CoA dehydrogenase family protein [Porticoccaceae bacterium]